jgi:predicted transcriptional regulator
MIIERRKEEGRLEMGYENVKSKVIALNINAPKENTPDWLRSFKGCEHYNDMEAIAVLDSLDILATILLGNASHKIRHIDNQQVVSLNEQEKIQKRAA